MNAPSSPSRADLPELPELPELPGTRPTLADAVDRVANSVVAMATRRHRLGAGMVWRPGMVLTCASALGQAPRVRLLRPDGDTVTGEVRGIDRGTDLALVAVDTGNATPAARRQGPPLRTGDFVFAAGRDASGLLHASFGHIGAAGGAWRTWRGAPVDRLLRLDGGLYPGLNGACVADADGLLVGLASAALSRHHGIVLPLITLDRVADQLQTHGRVMHGHLGIAAQAVELPPAMREAADGAVTGLLVAGIGDNSPAAQAGLLLGDLIVAAAGQPLPDVDALRDLLGGAQVGSTLPLSLLRGGQPIGLDVQVAEQPAARC